jgi:hypothetical protein
VSAIHRGGGARVAATVAAAAVVGLLVAAWPLSWVGLRCCDKVWPWPKANGGSWIDGPAVEWLKENSGFRDAVLTLPPDRLAIAPAGQVTPKGNYLGARPEYHQKAIAALAMPDIDALAEMGVRYLYVLEKEASPEQLAVLATAARQQRVTRVWADGSRGSAILRIEGIVGRPRHP